MAYVESTDVITNVGSELTGTAGATAKLDFSTAAGYDPDFRRKGVLLSNCGAATLYVKIVTRGGAAPTVTAANYHASVQVGSEVLSVHATRSVDLYLFGSAAYTAVEVG